MTLQEKALNRIGEVLGEAQANRLAPCIKVVAQTKGSALKFKRIAQAVDVEAIWDYFAEIRFGLIFAGLRYEIEFEPLSEKGPDLWISRDGQSAYVEVKRFRPSAQRRDPVDESNNDLTLKKYGNPLKDIAKVRAELLGKFVQVRRRNGIVAFWSDNDDLEDLEFGFAVMDVRCDFENQIQNVSDSFLFTVFASHWIDVSQSQQMYCKALRPLEAPFSAWVEELENAVVKDCIRVALKRLGIG